MSKRKGRKLTDKQILYMFCEVSYMLSNIASISGTYSEDLIKMANRLARKIEEHLDELKGGKK